MSSSTASRSSSNGEHTGKLPGTVLRSGRDTKTVAIDVMQHKQSAGAEPALAK